MQWAIRSALIVLATASLFAQPPAPATPPLFKGTVDLVRLDVRITDDNGRPIPDIRQDELQIADEGHERPIVQFQHIEEPRGATFAEAAQRTIATEVSTNRGAPRGHLYVLVFDTHHITAGNEMRARAAAREFLRSRVRPEDRVAVYALPGPGPSLYFSSDVKKAAASLDTVVGSLSRVDAGILGSMTVYEAFQIDRGDQGILSRVMGGYSTASGQYDLLSDVARPGGDDPRELRQLVQEDATRIVHRSDEDTRRFLQRFTDLLRSLKLYEGRKAVVLFSEGFYTDHVTRELNQVAAAAAQSYSVVFSLDLNSRMNDPSRAAPLGADQFRDIESRLEPLGTLAAATDGTLVTDAALHLPAALERIADASQDYYLVGFEPDPAALKSRNEYRNVRVTVKRPGAHVSTRTGYALSSDTPPDRRAAIDAAFAAPYPLQAIPVEYTTYSLGSEPPGYSRIVLSMSTELPVAADGQATADVVFAVKRLSDGQVAASGTDTILLPKPTTENPTIGRAKYRVQFAVPAGEYLMRLVVRDPEGHVGSADRRFTARAIGGPGVSAGDLILGSTASGTLPVHTTAYGSDLLSGVLEIYGRTAQQIDRARVTVDITPVGGDSPASSTVATLAPIRASSSGVARTAEFAVAAGSLKPGNYVAAARVMDSNGETVAELQRDVEIRAGSAPAASAEARSAIDPREVLTGEIARALITRIRQESPDYAAAADAALAGQWPAVEPAIECIVDQNAAGFAALRGLARFAAADFAGAADALQAAFHADPKDARIAFLLGWAERARQQPRAAVTAWRGAAYLDPSMVPAHLALADLYLELSQPDLAAQVLRAGIAAVPDSIELADKLRSLR